ncbi:MAG: DNA repair protein RadA [Candidatus Omnitrophica bacterium]|nr:DNA repair protein RadA [Candidatus Omnitrophota bacterium]
MKSIFTCQKCGYQSPKWLGRCPDCGEWNSLVEEVSEPSSVHPSEYSSVPPQSWTEIGADKDIRFSTGIEEFNRILGGGIVRGSVILVGGEPGIGKSTLLLQISNLLSKKQRVLYVTAEESVKQAKLRGQRLGIEAKELFIVSETNLNLITTYIKKISPCVVVIDSIQAIYKEDLSSAPGSISQIKECTARLTLLAKKEDISIFLIGQVTKEGYLSGPRVLEHIVDVVLYFEGDKYYNYRILRAIKNRFGSTNEIGIFEMSAQGLSPISNPSKLFMENREEKSPGSAVVCCMEGTRPLLVEIQALVTPTHFGIPARKNSGLDYNRCLLTLAVLQKKANLKLQMQDIFINVVGGIKIIEPAADLGIALSVVSNFRDRRLRSRCLFIGELGLGGEIRNVTQLNRRISEGEKLGFEYCLIPKSKPKPHFKDIKIIEVGDIEEAIEMGLEK